MPKSYDKAIATEIIQGFGARPEMLVQILHAFVDRYSCIGDVAMRQIADELNISRADIHSVVSFYHDFRTTPPGRHVVRICQAEACQSMGSRALTAHAEQVLGVRLSDTTADGELTLEPVYCLGNCACSPAIMIDNRVYGRVDNKKFDRLVDQQRAPG
jgi:formate dehydrogenase subunit gamma